MCHRCLRVEVEIVYFQRVVRGQRDSIPHQAWEVDRMIRVGVGIRFLAPDGVSVDGIPFPLDATGEAEITMGAAIVGSLVAKEDRCLYLDGVYAVWLRVVWDGGTFWYRGGKYWGGSQKCEEKVRKHVEIGLKKESEKVLKL